MDIKALVNLNHTDNVCEVLRGASMRFVGFDPGGQNAFGWAVLISTNSRLDLLGAGTCSSPTDAVRFANEISEIAPVAFATDAPLYWVTSGDREADSFVRKLVCAAGGKSGTVNHVNSMRGACLVQGIQVTRLASIQWPSAKATEAHPKALLLLNKGAREFLKSIDGKIKSEHEHERDAALAAYTAAAFVNQAAEWQDLALQDKDRFFPSGSSAAYWFPRNKT